ncbi:hypothetical protein E2C01_098758 [Portunus trituberculatus]|uniref:Uncharacterized protein n=1 Tax=Portunus trituberculatus TaxID=210409 RepID=A0A5B7KEZ2_PORTR|nr:hypothetical protein [Portunus trituberculatus]
MFLSKAQEMIPAEKGVLARKREARQHLLPLVHISFTLLPGSLKSSKDGNVGISEQPSRCQPPESRHTGWLRPVGTEMSGIMCWDEEGRRCRVGCAGGGEERDERCAAERRGRGNQACVRSWRGYCSPGR